jgi:hypothetical protein
MDAVGSSPMAVVKTRDAIRGRHATHAADRLKAAEGFSGYPRYARARVYAYNGK